MHNIKSLFMDKNMIQIRKRTLISPFENNISTISFSIGSSPPWCTANPRDKISLFWIIWGSTRSLPCNNNNNNNNNWGYTTVYQVMLPTLIAPVVYWETIQEKHEFDSFQHSLLNLFWLSWKHILHNVSWKMKRQHMVNHPLISNELPDFVARI